MNGSKGSFFPSHLFLVASQSKRSQCRPKFMVQELQLEKTKCDKALKELNKVVAPTKSWAKGKLDFTGSSQRASYIL